MAVFEIIMPKLGESIIEATITKWLKQAGEEISEDDPIVEIATDKVDSEIPSPIDGVITKLNFQEGDVVPVGAVIAIVSINGDDVGEPEKEKPREEPEIQTQTLKSTEKKDSQAASKPAGEAIDFSSSERFYSPLVKNIAKTENISIHELNSVPGSGKDKRVTKNDLLQYIEDKKSGKVSFSDSIAPAKIIEAPVVTAAPGDEVIGMDRMRRLIADHMVMSKQVSPHVTMFHEVDMTKVALWRNRIKEDFLKREGGKLTFTPIFIEVAARALRDYPLINASVDGYNFIKRKNVNIGMATALPNGNLIVPVIKNADQKNLAGLARDVNDLANRARNNKLNPDEIQNGTFTITNFGQFGNSTGSPIINQPQVAILGVGTIKKKPVVIETPEGDMIGIRHVMILSLAFDHRIVDGALGGMFLQKMANYLENFDTSRTI
jgi:2-oxoglutarate dehydrogenase E2 component (dihydrolipoamide succinyltransferase)